MALCGDPFTRKHGPAQCRSRPSASEAGRRRRVALKWQRLRPYEKFAAMIDRHWDGIAAYCRPENKVALGFVEGLILTCMLPVL